MTHLRANAQSKEEAGVRALERVTEGYLTLDRVWRVAFCSREVETLLHVPVGDVLGREVWAALPWLRNSVFERALRRTAGKSLACSVISFRSEPAGWLEMSCYPAPDGVAVYFRDVTARKSAEMERRLAEEESERRRRIYEVALSHTSDLNYVFDLQGRLVYANPALLALWEKPIDAIVGCDFADLGYEPGVAAHLKRQIQQVIDTGQPLRDEGLYTRGSTTWAYEYILNPVLGADGKVEAVAGSSRDITERKRLEAHTAELLRRLETQQGRLTRIFREAPSFMCVLRGPEHIVEMANDRFIEHVGQRDMVGRKLREAFPEFANQIFPQLLDQVYRTGEEYVARDTRITLRRTPNGPLEERIVDLVYHPLHDTAEVVSGILMHGVDLTERKQAEDELKSREESYRRAAIAAASAAEANAKFRVFFEQGTQFAAVLGVDGRVIETNRPCLEACGFTDDAVLRKSFWECGWWNRSVELQERVRRAVAHAASGQIFRQETPYFKSNGDSRVVDLALTPALGENGQVLFVAVTGTDITERKRAEIAVRQSEARIRRITDSIPVLIWETDLNGLTFANRHYLDFFGRSFEELKGLGWAAFLHPDDVKESLHMYEDVHARQEGRVTQARLRRHDGEYRWLLSSGFPHFSENREFLGFVGSSYDITELKKAEEVQRNAAAKLADADRQKDEFLALLAHELRNPLAPLQSGLQMLDLAMDNPPEFQQAREMMERQLRHMVRLIDDLLDVSRVVTNKMELRRTRVSLAEIFRDAIETADPLIAAARHEFTVSLPDPDVYLDADLTRMAQVISNLLINSAKYTPSGGHIWLSAEVKEKEVAIIVKDTGIGIPRESLDSIFNMFTQVDRSAERLTGGLGIGLALVKGLVVLHGGQVVADSPGLNAGSTFTVTLPLAVPMEPIQQPAAEAATVGGVSKHRILVVDDHRDAALGMAAVLKSRRHEVAVAHSGTAALEIAEQFRPEVILMDIGMPGLNGYETTRKIRDAAWGKSMFIIAVTGWGQDADRVNSQKAGCDAHLVKPVRLGDLEELIARVPTGGRNEPAQS